MSARKFPTVSITGELTVEATILDAKISSYFDNFNTYPCMSEVEKEVQSIYVAIRDYICGEYE